jgi:ribose transport system ATP-binding protein
VLSVHDLGKRFGATVALDGVSLDVRGGEVHALIGENGAGKSTLMNILAGSMRPDRGTMRIDDHEYAPASPLDARHNGIALIHQELSLCPHLTVAENIGLGLENATYGWIDADESRRRAMSLLEQFGHADIDPDRRVKDLALAAQQVVEICRALAANARVLLMDEPTSMFQREDTERLFALVRRLTTEGIAVIYISHFLEEVREVADRYTVLRDGLSVDSGTIAESTNERLIARMVGRPEGAGGIFPTRAHPAPNAPVILSLSHLSAPGVKDASFELRRGEILGIAGLMGSGRTELVRALYGLAQPTAGTMTFDGKPLDLRHDRASDRLHQGFGYVSEDRKGEGLALPLSIADNLTATRHDMFSHGGGWLDIDEQQNVSRRWIETLRIRARSPEQSVRSLSGGNQQKVAIGRLLHQDANVLLLDEPTRGVDIGSKAQVYEIVARCAADGKGVLMVSSYLPELFGLCDRLAVMRRGRLSPARPIDEWTPQSVLAEALGGTPD